MKRVYLSHPIMGVEAMESTEETIAKNCRKAIEYGEQLRKNYPDVEFYIPAEHEAFVHRAYKMGCLSIDQILEIDCDIISDCDMVILYNHEGVLSNGMKIEAEFAYTHFIPTFNWLAVETIGKFLLKE